MARANERNRVGNLTLVRVAVGEVADRITLCAGGPFGADIPGMRSRFGPGRAVGSLPVVRLDDWAREAGLERLDLIKLDIEGGELMALVDMRETLGRLRPRLLFVERNPVTLERTGATKNQLYAELARSGYEPAGTIPDHESIENVVFMRGEELGA